MCFFLDVSERTQGFFSPNAFFSHFGELRFELHHTQTMCFIKDKGRENARPGRIFQRIGMSELTDAGGTLRCFEDATGKYRSKKR